MKKLSAFGIGANRGCVTGVLLVVATLGWGCHREPKVEAVAELPPAQVRAANIVAVKQRAIEEVVGSVRSRTRAVIEAKVSGRIERMHAVPGRSVNAGDLLAELDVREIRAKVEQARAVALQSDRDYERGQGLFKQEAITRAELEGMEARRGVARASVVEAETLLEYARIVAPFRGVITRRLADVGDLAVPGKPLMELEDPQALRFEADVPAALVEWVRPGQELGVRLGTSSAWVNGTVNEIEPVADPVSRTFRIRLDLPSGTEARGGWFGRMALPLDEVAVTTVPASAVRVRGQMELVWVIVEGRARLRIIKTGQRIGEALEVLSGLEAGEVVVVDGAGSLKEGQAVVTR